MTETQRWQFRYAVKAAAKKAARNPRPDQSGLASELFDEGLRWLD